MTRPATRDRPKTPTPPGDALPAAAMPAGPVPVLRSWFRAERAGGRRAGDRTTPRPVEAGPGRLPRPWRGPGDPLPAGRLSSRILLLASLLAGLLAGPATADPALPAGLVPAYLAPQLAAVVRVSAGIAAPGGCSGVLVTPSHVLTAAHCARGGGPRVVIVHPAEDGLRRIAAVAATALHPDTRPGLSVEAVGADLALLTLATPVAPEIATPLPLAPPEAAGGYLVAGYPNGGNVTLHAHLDCRLAGIAPAVLASDCTVVPGFSGGPVLRDTGDGFALVAILSASSGTAGSGVRALAAAVDPATFPALARALEDAPQLPPVATPAVAP